MKVAINNWPLKSAHKYRGIGYYTKQLIEALKQDHSLKLQEFVSLSEVSAADIVHYPWFDLFFHTLPIKKRFPTVVTIHDVIPLIFPKYYPIGLKGKFNLMMQKLALRGCKYIVTDSEVSKRDIVKYLKIDIGNIAVIPLSADPKFKLMNNDTKLLYIKRKYHLPDKFILYVGDVNWIKNMPFLIEGFKEIIRHPDFSSVKLVLVGGVFLKDVENIDHPELKSLKLVNQLIKQYNLTTHVVKPGQIEDDELVAFYNLATVYVHPSLYEGFGLPILQAFACGTPVVSSDGGGISEIGGEAAIYFNPADLQQFVSILKDLLKDRSLQSKLSKLGLQQAAKFSWKMVADQTKLVYFKAMNK